MSKKEKEILQIMDHIGGKRVDFFTSTTCPHLVTLTGRVMQYDPISKMIGLVDCVNMHGEEEPPQHLLISRIKKLNIATIQDNWRALIKAKSETNG